MVSITTSYILYFKEKTLSDSRLSPCNSHLYRVAIDISQFCDRCKRSEFHQPSPCPLPLLNHELDGLKGREKLLEGCLSWSQSASHKAKNGIA